MSLTKRNSLIRSILSKSLSLFLLLLFSLNTHDAHAIEVGIIIDTSISMRKSDQEQYAILASKLIADILDPTEDDLFVVFFNDKYKSARDNASHKLIRWSKMKTTGRPGDFTSKIHSELTHYSRYDAKCTYFAPSLRFALSSFTGKSGPKLLIFLTDGQTNDLKKDRGCFFSNGRDERALFDDDISKKIIKDKIKVAPLLLSKNLKKKELTELRSSYYLTFFDGQGRMGEPLQEVKEAVDLPYQFAKLLTKMTSRQVERIGKLKNKPKTLTKLQSQHTPGFDVDAALSHVDVITVAGGGFLNNPISSSQSSDIQLIQPMGNIPTWIPNQGEVALGRHESHYGKHNTQKKSSYLVLRTTDSAQGKPPLQGHWGVFKSTRKLKPHAFIVKYYSFKLDLDTQSKRRSIPLDQPLCLRAFSSTRNAARNQPLPPSLLKKVEITVSATFTEKGLPLDSSRVLKNIKRLKDDGKSPDLTMLDSSWNNCIKLSMADLGLTPEQLRTPGELGYLHLKASLIYNGEELAQSKDLDIKVLPPMILDGVGVVQFYGQNNEGIAIRELSCNTFNFSKKNSILPVDQFQNNTKKNPYAFFSIELKNVKADPIFDKLRVSICSPDKSDHSDNEDSPKKCKNIIDPQTGNGRFPDIPAWIYNQREAIPKTVVELDLEQTYLICLSPGFRYEDLESSDPVYGTGLPLFLSFKPEHKEYQDRFPVKPTPKIKEFDYGIGPKWEIEGQVLLHIRLSEPTWLQRWWPLACAIFLLILAFVYLIRSKIRINLPHDLEYRIWEIHAQPSQFSNTSKVPRSNRHEIKELGITLETYAEIRSENGEGVFVLPDQGVSINARDINGIYQPLHRDHKGHLHLALGITYQILHPSQAERYVIFIRRT